MMNLINFLQITSEDDMCSPSGLNPVLRIVGIVILGIKIVVPIILIVVGMLDLAKAVGEKDEKQIKESQNKLVKRAIEAVLVFLVITLVGVVMSLVGGEQYKNCMDCINHPFSKCPQSSDDGNNGGNNNYDNIEKKIDLIMYVCTGVTKKCGSKKLEFEVYILS